MFMIDGKEVCFIGFLVEGRKLMELNIINTSRNTNEHIMKQFLTIDNNLHFDVGTIQLEHN